MLKLLEIILAADIRIIFVAWAMDQNLDHPQNSYPDMLVTVNSPDVGLLLIFKICGLIGMSVYLLKFGQLSLHLL